MIGWCAKGKEEGSGFYDDRGDIAWTGRPGGLGAADRYGPRGDRPSGAASHRRGSGGRGRFGRRHILRARFRPADVLLWSRRARPATRRCDDEDPRRLRFDHGGPRGAVADDAEANSPPTARKNGVEGK